MNESKKEAALNLIYKNILEFGYHVTLVQQGCLPRFAYTIGLIEKLGYELALPGASFYMADEIFEIIKNIYNILSSSEMVNCADISIKKLGNFSINNVDQSWHNELLLGAIDFYGEKKISALQIRPDLNHSTIDVPDLSLPWDSAREPVWRWLKESWGFPISATSSAATNLAALRGAHVTEASRWEETEWELFAGSGPDTPHDEIRVVPVATLLAVDPSLQRVVSMNVGQSLWRNADASEWNNW